MGKKLLAPLAVISALAVGVLVARPSKPVATVQDAGVMVKAKKVLAPFVCSDGTMAKALKECP